MTMHYQAADGICREFCALILCWRILAKFDQNAAGALGMNEGHELALGSGAGLVIEHA